MQLAEITHRLQLPGLALALAGLLQLVACSSADTVTRSEVSAERSSGANVEVLEWRPDVSANASPVTPGSGMPHSVNSQPARVQQNPWKDGQADASQGDRWWVGYEQQAAPRRDKTCDEQASADRHARADKSRPWGDATPARDRSVTTQPASIWHRNTTAPPRREEHVWSQNAPRDGGWQTRQADRNRPVYSW